MDSLENPSPGSLSFLTNDEIKKLVAAKTANPEYFIALMMAVSIMPARRAKYSGEVDPFTNFITMGRMLDIKPEQTFKFYVALKLARALVQEEDFADESLADTLCDLANYTLLWAGYHRRLKIRGE